jgi:hypothetical protein
MIKFNCPGCGGTFRVEEQFAGQESTCTKCGARFDVPGQPLSPLGRAKTPEEMAEFRERLKQLHAWTDRGSGLNEPQEKPSAPFLTAQGVPAAGGKKHEVVCGCLVGLAILVCVVWAFWSGAFEPKETYTPDGGTSTFTSTAYIGVSEEALDRYMQLLRAGDSMGMFQMAAAEQVVAVNSGTRYLVIDRGFSKSEVRIQSGEYMGCSGWVMTDELRR